MTLSSQSFQTTIAQSGEKTYLEIPFDPNATWGSKERHYVTGAIDDCPIRGCLVCVGTQYYLVLGPAWRRDNGIEAGANVTVVLSPDGPQSESLAADLAAAFATEPQARTFFDSLAPFYRNNYLRWIESARRPETRRVRIAEMLRLLNAGKRQR
jgi:hypothetical protein